jgi:hypothetical protein
MGNPVEKNGMETGIAEEHFKDTPCSRITFKY